MKKISVIIPVYNRADVLERCVRSVLEQTWKNVEIILSDDGSSDGSADLCFSLADQYESVRTSHILHRGASAARNTGLAAADGDYVCFLDSDDMIAPEMLERLYEDMSAAKADMACCRFRIESGSTEKFLPEYGKAVPVSPYEAIEKMFMNDGYLGYGVSPGTKLIRKDLLMKPYPLLFPENIIFGEDAMWIVKLLERAECVVMDSSVMMRYSFECSNSVCRNTHPMKKLLLAQWKLNYLKEGGHTGPVIEYVEQEGNDLLTGALLSGKL